MVIIIEIGSCPIENRPKAFDKALHGFRQNGDKAFNRAAGRNDGSDSLEPSRTR
jgi:hypothetical protein